MRVSREELLRELELVQPGLSSREIIEQSSCFVFQEGRVVTFNDEVACQHSSCLDFTGAVQSGPLLGLLRKMTEADIDVEAGDGELVIKGKKRSAGVRMEKEVTLPIDAVEPPKKWKRLPDNFSDAVDMVVKCASRNENEFALTCVHITDKYVESSDNFQMVRFRTKVPVREKTLVRHSSITHIVSLGVTKMAETENWIHFKTADGLIISCRRYLESYLKLGPHLKVTGTPTALPKGLAEAVEKAEVFSTDNAERNDVLVTLSPGKLRIRGEGASGWYTEGKKLSYKGSPMKFQISPKLLVEITKRFNECEIGPTSLKVDGGGFTYVTCLAPPDDKEDKEGGDKPKKKKKKGSEKDAGDDVPF